MMSKHCDAWHDISPSHTLLLPQVVPRTGAAAPPEKPAGAPTAAQPNPTAAAPAATAAMSRIPVSVTTQATAVNPTYSSMRRQSGIGTGGPDEVV